LEQERRRSQRYSADWTAQYRLDGADPWRACRVTDVSFDGAALELLDVTTVEAVSGPIELRVSSVAGDSGGVLLRAVLRRTVRIDDRVLVGVEFSVLRAEERNLLHLLVGLRTLQ
jgi:hypothetical protein